MKLMLSNDDGVHAPGLRTLRQSLEQAGYGICVVAPDRDRSGASNSLTLDRPLHPVHLDADVISVNGTPTESVSSAEQKRPVRKPSRALNLFHQSCRIHGTRTEAFSSSVVSLFLITS